MFNLWEWFCRVSLITVILIALHSFLGDVMFRFQYSFPKVSETATQIIDASKDPIQVDIQDGKYIKAYGNNKVYALKPQAEYSISALIIAKNSNFWFRDIMRNKFDEICLMDLGLAWGELAQNPKQLYKDWKFKSQKTLGQARSLNWRNKTSLEDGYWDTEYVRTHIAHTHIIPANSNVMSGILKAKKNELVKLDGYLVDIYTGKSELIAKTSLSRNDTNATSRGYGACEDMYVKSVQIGNKIYK